MRSLVPRRPPHNGKSCVVCVVHIVPLNSPVARVPDAPNLRKVLKWMYEGAAESFEDMTNIPKALRAKLARVATVGALKVPVLLSC